MRCPELPVECGVFKVEILFIFVNPVLHELRRDDEQVWPTVKLEACSIARPTHLWSWASTLPRKKHLGSLETVTLPCEAVHAIVWSIPYHLSLTSIPHPRGNSARTRYADPTKGLPPISFNPGISPSGSSTFPPHNHADGTFHTLLASSPRPSPAGRSARDSAPTLPHPKSPSVLHLVPPSWNFRHIYHHQQPPPLLFLRPSFRSSPRIPRPTGSLILHQHYLPHRISFSLSSLPPQDQFISSPTSAVFRSGFRLPTIPSLSSFIPQTQPPPSTNSTTPRNGRPSSHSSLTHLRVSARPAPKYHTATLHLQTQGTIGT